jgi:hypothetical protein
MNVRSTSSTNWRDADRFMAKVVEGMVPAHRPDLPACLLWTGGTNNKGYGIFRLGSMRDGTRRQVLVHRFIFTFWHGREPDGVVDHLCRVHNCVNIWHLEDVTQRINLLRGDTIAAAHAAKTCCPSCSGPYNTRQGKYGPRRYCPTC